MLIKTGIDFILVIIAITCWILKEMEDLKDFPASIQIITASLTGIRDALILWKTANDRLTGDAAALRGNLLNLVIDNLNDLVIEPLQEVRYK